MWRREAIRRDIQKTTHIQKIITHTHMNYTVSLVLPALSLDGLLVDVLKQGSSHYSGIPPFGQSVMNKQLNRGNVVVRDNRSIYTSTNIIKQRIIK